MAVDTSDELIERSRDRHGHIDKRMLHSRGVLTDNNLFGPDDVNPDPLGGTELIEANGFSATGILGGRHYWVAVFWGGELGDRVQLRGWDADYVTAELHRREGREFDLAHPGPPLSLDLADARSILAALGTLSDDFEWHGDSPPGCVVTETPGPEFATLRELLGVLGYDADSDAEVEGLIEEYADTYLEEELGMGLVVNLGAGEAGDGMLLVAEMSFYTDDAVQMWVLDAPFTVGGLHQYLDELDVRVRRLRAILELPPAGHAGVDEDEDTNADEDAVSIAGALATLFERDRSEVVDQLGDSWVSIEGAAMGSHGVPVRYLLWEGCLVVALDEEYVYLFTATVSDGEVEIGEEIATVELGSGTTIGLEEFASALRSVRAVL